MKKLKIKLLEDQELTAQEIHSSIDEELSCYVTQDAEGRLKIEIDIQQELSTSSIDEFVNAVAFSDDGKLKKMVDILEYYPRINHFLNKYNPSYFYSPKTTLFYDSVKQTVGIGIFHEFLPINFSQNHGKFNPDLPLFEKLVATMRNVRSSTEFKNKLKKWEENLERSYKSSAQYIDALFDKYAKLLVVRLDLGFRKPNGMDQEELSIEKTKRFLSQFLNAKRSNKIFNDLVGYVWKLEYGELKGYHYHLLIFLNGSDTQKDVYRGLLMGQYWIYLTREKGIFHIGNFKKRYFEKHGLLGIGMISYFEKNKRKNLDTILRYFFKSDQYLKEKPFKGTRTCGKGEIASLNRTNIGRPRKKRYDDN